MSIRFEEPDQSYEEYLRVDEEHSPREEREHRIPLDVRCDIAAFFVAAGRKPCFSTSIADELTSGFGYLDEFGFWEYPVTEGEE